jgi:hypothetical protein
VLRIGASKPGNTVNLEKLTKQLRRDMAANPKKAAALGLMVLVALYFWGPLVWKAFSDSGSKRNNKANMTALILTDDPDESAHQSKGPSGGKFRWEKIRQLIRQDERMASATFDVSWIDPFGKPAAKVEPEAVVETPLVETEASAVAAALAKIEPSDLGITLGGVMVGPRSRLATINGETCREGDVIAVADKVEKSASHEFRVLKITRQGVQLESSGRIFTLELRQPKLGQGDEIESRKTKR